MQPCDVDPPQNKVLNELTASFARLRCNRTSLRIELTNHCLSSHYISLSKSPGVFRLCLGAGDVSVALELPRNSAVSMLTEIVVSKL